MELHFKEYGAGEPLLILHGLFGTLDNWQNIAKKLGESYTVFSLDLRNHGKSYHSNDPYTYPALAEEVQQFMEQHWVYEARVVGHSMGGKVAMQLALLYPDLVKKLVVIDIAPKAYKGGHEAVFDALFGLDLTALTDRKTAETYLMQRLEHDFGTVQFLLKNLTRKTAHEGGGFEWKMNLSLLWQYYPDILKTLETEQSEKYEKSTLFVRGDKSDYIKDQDMPLIHDFFPKATLQTVSNAGHWVHADQPETLTNILIDFLI